MKSFAVAALVGIASASSEIEAAFMGYITQFGKSYNTIEEYNMRLHNFAQKHSVIVKHNAEGHTYKLGYNNMTDWTEEEYKAILTLTPMEQPEVVFQGKPGSDYSPIDWRDASNCVPAIRDQGQCGSCWAFSSVASIQTDFCIKHSTTVNTLSEQQLVDCVKNCYGCNGGNAQFSFYYYLSHNAMTNSSYPYTARTGTCKFNSGNTTDVKTVGAYGYVGVAQRDPEAMKQALTKGILSVAIQADQYVFQSY